MQKMNDKDFYDTTFLYDTLYLLENHLTDLTQWSVYNEDVCEEDILELREKFEQVKKILFLVGKTLDSDTEMEGENE